MRKRILAFILAVILLLGIVVGAGTYFTNKSSGGKTAADEKEDKINNAYNTVTLMLSENDYKSARAAAEKCLGLITRDDHPDIYADLYLKLACIDAIEGNNEDALKNADTALEVDETLSDAYLLKAGIESDRGNTEKAIVQLKQYLKYSDDEASYRDLGIWQMQTEKYSEAVESFTTYIEKTGKTDDATYYRGICRLALNEYDSAIADFDICYGAGINKDDSLFNRALCKLLLEQYEDAAEDYELCVENGINPEESGNYLELCRQYMAAKS